MTRLGRMTRAMEWANRGALPAASEPPRSGSLLLRLWRAVVDAYRLSQRIEDAVRRRG